ncbi:MAG: glycosyltransferase family 39 protein [Chloroflexi bacterium]|nr:glycosyltransferase family 39 protein [Chloroflexota bacterium]
MNRTTLQRIAIPVILLMAVWLIFLLSVHRSMQYDESFTFLRYAQSPFVALFAYELPNNHLLHSFGVWLMTSLMGDSTIVIRFVSMAAGLLCTAVLFRMTRRIAGTGAGALAVALLMITPMWAEMIANARGYTLSALLTLLFIGEIIGTGRRYSFPNRRVLFVLTLLLTITLPTMALLYGAALIWVLLRMWRGDPRKRLVETTLLPIIAGAVTGGAFYVSVFVYGRTSVFGGFGEPGIVELITVWTTQVFAMPLSLVLLIGIVIGIAVLWQRNRDFLALCGIIVGVVLAFSILQDIVTGRTFFARNFFYLIPLVTLVGGVGLARAIRAVPIASAVLTTFLLIASAALFISLNEPTASERFTIEVGKHIEPGDLLLVDCCYDAPLEYAYRATPELFAYSPDKQRAIFVEPKQESAEALPELFKDMLPLDLASCHPEDWGETRVEICALVADSADG